MKKIWNITSYNERNNNSALLAELLADRGIKSSREKEIYLEADLKYLSDPFLLPGMEDAVNRIQKAVKNNERILVYGDYDVDGITSTSLLYLFFKKSFGIEIEFFLPDRIKDGYGLNKSSLEEISKREIDLIITVDCGITAFKEAEYLKDLDIDLIITDHHTPADKLPAAEAVINHHLVEKKDYFAAEIAGVGTAFKLIQALNKNKLELLLDELLPIVALGTIADIAPLKAENRILVKNGLERISKEKNLGLKSLIDELAIDKNNVSAGQIAFIIAPPLNAAGRIHDAEEALRLLITEDKAEAEKISKKLVQINKKRQMQEEKIYKSAEKKIEKLNLEEEKSIVLADEDWHSGIIGIVASRLLEKYHLPVILFAVDNESKIAKGSARSIYSLNIYKALKYCSSEMISFGGHKAAAGLSIKESKIDAFKNKFKSYLEGNLIAEDYLERNKIDLNLDLSQINKELIEDLNKFSPFGIANPSPKFIFKNIKAGKCYQIGKENKHLKFYLNSGIQAIAFNLGERAAEISASNIDLIAQPEINRWKGQENIQLKVDDFRRVDDFMTPIVFKRNNYNFYDLRNLANKNLKLEKLLKTKVINRAAVYLNHKKERKSLEKSYHDHYLFGSDYNFRGEFSHLIFYSLPFSLKHFVSIINKFKAVSKVEEKKIILLFSEKEIKNNIKIIKYINKQQSANNSENQLDFKGSIRYNKLSRRMEKFMNFKELVFKENLFDLITNVSNFKEDKNES